MVNTAILIRWLVFQFIKMAGRNAIPSHEELGGKFLSEVVDSQVAFPSNFWDT